ncbi:Dynamin [Penicillium riverlandense]|uniref:Dynamin n=1 Tax=Penicillium riverlandense TaxID=1903569 RepID=UPI00254757C8|nr:Dynamin [Penicillium riverlandense]KAJ5807942.1 Dynamin [Penicillium riverlandense]
MRQSLSANEEDGDLADASLDNIGPGIRPGKTSERLNQIDRVRANGVGDYVELPQLVVCGDQSAGKSSVLEGISGYPFPRKDGVCTQFPTEIVLRHDNQVETMTASLLPSASRSSEEREKFAAFQRDFLDFNELPGIIQEASHLMGIRGFSDVPDAPAFAADVLRLEFTGNTGLHLTLVDLPGLISVSDDDKDVELVRGLVDSYLESSRTIILAVIPASSDAETQGIIQRARHFDKDGVRTIGIITKPDLINEDTEERVARLAKNLHRTKLNLGFFLLKNPSPAELLDGLSFSQRRRKELEFFSSGRWRAQNLNPSRVGIDNLRSFLAEILDSHIERELPKVQEEIRRLLKRINEEIHDLGIERSSPNQIRMFLTRISTDFHGIAKNGLEGNYDSRDGSFFSTNDSSRRLRAAIQSENEKFAEYMRTHGQRRKVVSNDGNNAFEAKSEEEEDVSEGGKLEGEERDKDGQTEELRVTKNQMSAWIKEMYHQSRGRELPGNYNPSLLQRLFHIQSSRWESISQRHLQSVVSLVTRFVDSALKFIVTDTKVRDNLRRRITETLGQNAQKAHQELVRLVQDEQCHPITYNHYYTDNIQRARHDDAKARIKKSVDKASQMDWGGVFHFSNSPDEMNRLISALQARVEVNMVDRACSEALTDLNAYYKVAMKTFVDNVCRQVIERHILATLADVLDPAVVSGYSDEELLQLAAESPQTRRRRADALELQQALEQSLKDLSF